VPSKYVNRPNSSCKENNQSALDRADCGELLIGEQKAMLLLAKLCRISTIFVKKPNTPTMFLHWHMGGENIIVNNLELPTEFLSACKCSFCRRLRASFSSFFRSFPGTLL
jgi:hypothetical protein